MRTMLPLLAASVLAACSTAPQPFDRSERAEALLQRELAGLAVTGPPQSCIPHYRADQMTVVDDRTILFRDGPSRVWRNETRGNCESASLGSTLVFRTTTGMLCANEIAQVVDLSTGANLGSCVLGDFTPYGRP